MDFESYFETVKPIILKLRRHYFVKLWDYDDWIQEGRIVFFKLLQEHPVVLINEGRRYTYFKTKFSNHVKDNRMPYEEIGEISHCVPQLNFFEVADFIAYRDSLSQLKATLSLEEQEKLAKVVRGERFEGKKAFLRQIEPYFSDFKH
ncbi:sigma-70 family RNA polymerase sigma factor [uncultured Streptococcus sp.]|uniref:sigma-70 family RNA polymerase sigma factor n=1 Tax=uncultured Streptococcus sp. TaxID=83427 RepID=UPI0025866EFC|nr:sigma-70 family RNA polymerase sigma factor [uncultured Streptococcus sp.]